jgi:uncharacterized protein (TIGR02284 family)
MNEETVRALNELIQLDLDAVRAYGEAVEACAIVEVRSQLQAFLADHQRHVRELESAVRALGGEPAGQHDLERFLREGFTAIACTGDRYALFAMRGNEVITCRAYESLRAAEMPAEVRALIERSTQDEARHLAWLRSAVDDRLWDAEERPVRKAA